jgi:hypothetical protein
MVLSIDLKLSIWSNVMLNLFDKPNARDLIEDRLDKSMGLDLEDIATIAALANISMGQVYAILDDLEEEGRVEFVTNYMVACSKKYIVINTLEWCKENR